MLLRFVVLFSLLLRVSLGSNDENGDKDVVRGVPLELTDATFDQAIVSNEFGFPFHFVGFFSSNCPHCISLLPVWRLLAKEYKEVFLFLYLLSLQNLFSFLYFRILEKNMNPKKMRLINSSSSQ